MNAAVTGATGFLGRALLRVLVSEGGRVRALVRRGADEAALRGLGVEPVRGDITVADGCAGLVQSGDVVFHAAARVEMTGRWADFLETTVTGTRRVLEAALPHNPARFIYVSSAAVYLGPHASGTASAERTPARPWRYNYYARAKLAAEQVVRTECERAHCPWTILRLGFLYGPGNHALLTHFVPLARRGRVLIVGGGRNRIATLYVDDAAHALMLAGAHPAARKRVFDVASDERVTQREFVQATAQALGLPRPVRTVNPRLGLAAAGLAELWARLRGGTPLYTRALVRLMAADQQLDAADFRIELGWKPKTAFADGMRHLAEWYGGLASERAVPA